MQKFGIALLLAGALCLGACGRSGESSAALKAIDTDNDGTIDLAEAQAAGAKIFAKLNTDNDKTLEAKELDGRLDAAAIKAADPDNDGSIDAKEYEALIAERFKAADPDNDGTLDKKELHSPAGKELLKLIY
jgi:Ca2+-binding EF-hand superfamily protein